LLSLREVANNIQRLFVVDLHIAESLAKKGVSGACAPHEFFFSTAQLRLRRSWAVERTIGETSSLQAILFRQLLRKAPMNTPAA
jgi:hypothetical protein